MPVEHLPNSTVKRITSSQIITSVSGCVKELVENSLDAGARSIEVRLENFGFDRIEIRDDGTGLGVDDVPLMCLKSCTSKISHLSDLDRLESYGFRGEALNAICALGSVSVTTRTPQDSIARYYSFDSNGSIQNEKLLSGLKGTVVVVENLFKNTPVRRQFYTSGKRKNDELKKVELVVKSLVVLDVGLRLKLTHNQCTIWQKTKANSLIESVSQVVPPPVAKQLEILNKVHQQVELTLLIPKKDCTVSAACYGLPSEPGLLFVNRRPVRHKALEKVIRGEIEEYFTHNIPERKTPFWLASIQLPGDTVDVNLEPNKTQVALTDLELVISTIKDMIVDYYVSDSGVKRKSQEEPEGNQDVKHARLESDSPSEEPSVIDLFFQDMSASPKPPPESQSPSDSSPFVRTSVKILNSDDDEDFLEVPDCSLALPPLESSTPQAPQAPASPRLSQLTLSQWSRGQALNSSNSIIQGTVQLSGQSHHNDRQDQSPVISTSPEPPQPTSLGAKINSQSERSISSQMGCKQMSAFTKFARDVRSTIINQEGISFTKVASELASRWNSLDEEQKHRYKLLSEEEKQSKAKAPELPQTKPCSTLQGVTRVRSRPGPQLSVNVESVKQALDRRLSEAPEDSPRLVATLDSKVALSWSHEQVLGVVSLRGLTRASSYIDNLQCYKMPGIGLAQPSNLFSRNEHEHLWPVASCLQTSIDSQGQVVVSDPRVVLNGFSLVQGGELLVTHVPCLMVDDYEEGLVHVLSRLTQEGLDCPVSECRPPALANYILEETTKQLSDEAQAPVSLSQLNRWFTQWTQSADHVKSLIPIPPEMVHQDIFSLQSLERTSEST